MKKYTLIILSSLLFAFTSCNNWLDVELDNKIEDTKLFTSASGFKEALAGVYSELSKSPLYGQRLSMEYMDILAGFYSYNAIRSTYEDWKDYDYESSASASVISGIWNSMYSNIAQVNCILYWADENASMLSEADRNQIRGEALGLRAYLHFDLYRMFSPDVKRQPKAEGIPYNKEFGVSIPPMYTAEESVQLVINDLLEAEQCLQNDPIEGVIPYEIRTVTDQGEIIDAAAKNEADQYVARINLYAVKAMLARAYQARGEYDKAIEKAQEVIDCGKFRLLDFTSIDQTESSVDLLFSDEHVFSLRNQDIDSYSKDLHRDIVSGSGTQGTALPFSDTYIEENIHKVCRTGCYALCRHPGFWVLAGAMVSLALSVMTWHMWIVAIMVNVGNFIYICYQDKVSFPCQFDDYDEYKKEVPFLIFTSQSIKKCISTWR